VTKLALIVAVSSNGVIGVENRLPWHLPEDLKFFRRVTMGKPIIMGRRTYEAIGKPLPGRTNIVLTRHKSWRAPDVEICYLLEDAVNLAYSVAARDRVNEVIVIGGEQIYLQALPLASRIYLTRVEKSLLGDSYFPELEREEWRETLIGQVSSKADMPGYRFFVLNRSCGHH
jgi:dihydrofolate reductase